MALTQSGELWAYPAGGAARVLADREVDPSPGLCLDVSPDGRWLSVSGNEGPKLYKVGTLTPGAAAEPDALLPGWEKHSFPDWCFRYRTCFTGDSAYWAGRTEVTGHFSSERFSCWRLSDLTPFEYAGFPDADGTCVGTVPGTSRLVIESRSRDRWPHIAFWAADLARPDDPVTTPGSVEWCDRFRIGSDGRFFVSCGKEVRIYSARDGGLHLDLTVPPLPLHLGYGLSILLSADARRFVAYSSGINLVCAVETATGEVLGPWDWNIGQVNDAAISPDGLTAAAAGSNKKLVVWDLDR